MSEDKKGMMNSIQEMAKNLGLGKVTFSDEGIAIADKEETEVEVKEPVIGEFKPKRKFLSFVSAMAGKRIRLIRETAFIKGESLSGTLEGAKFKLTICDEGTINFSEVEGTNLSDTAMRQRLIDDIDAIDVTGYAQKFIVAGLEFEDQDGYKCFLEVEHVKPYDKLMALFAEEETKEIEEPTELSEKGLNFLDMLLSEDTEVETETEPVVEPVKEETYLEKQFRLMNEGKVNELKERIEKTEAEIKRYFNEAKHAEANAEKSTEALSVLETRLESLVPNATPNGYVFLVSDEQTSEITLDTNGEQLVDKISTLLKIKKDKLVKYLTEGHYKISIAKKDDFEDKKVTKEIYQLIQSVDLLGKFTAITDGEFEYRGKLNWHQLTAKMLKKGFEQEPEFDKVAGSNSYEVKTEREVLSDDGGFVLIGEKTAPNTVHPTREFTKKVENPEFKQQTLRTFDKPETIVVIGDGEEFQITDDESGFDLYVGGEYKHGVCCFGFGSVMTLNEYKNWQQNNDLEDSIDMVDAYLIPGFVGTIGISAKLDDGSYSNEFDLDDYICHQFDGYADVVINFPEGTELYEIKNHDLSTVTAALRDDKIAAVLS
jgi:predicted adenine nucleotide alpha hydrolase (AANH) superfamily ATPase